MTVFDFGPGKPIRFSTLILSYNGVKPMYFSKYYNLPGNYCDGVTGIPSSGEFALSKFIGASFIALSTGGTQSQSNGYNINTFTVNDTFTINVSKTINYLIVGGGGSGGFGNDRTGGGGGAGGYLIGTFVANPGTNYSIVVGKGGLASTSSVKGYCGNNSVISGTGITTITAYGGGYGGYSGSVNPSVPIGCGGGAYQNGYGMSGTAIQHGNTGGNGYNGSVSHVYSGGGGGGAGGVGVAGDVTGGGAGGPAVQITSTELVGYNSTLTICGGGAGGTQTTTQLSFNPSIGGSAGTTPVVYSGGNGGVYPLINTNPTPGQTYGGGGGGGGGNIINVLPIPDSATGGAGANGIVVFTYLL